MVGELSPSTWWSDDGIIGDIQQTLPAPNRPLRVYLDCGSGDADDEVDTDQLAAAYVALGYQEGADYHYVVQQGGQHSEIYWAERFPGAMQTLLGER
jgi:predicted alpha/beta superfamily hydrolase